MRHLVRDISRVLTLFLASRQAWPKILGGVSMFFFWGGELPPKRCLDKTLYNRNKRTYILTCVCFCQWQTWPIVKSRLCHWGGEVIRSDEAQRSAGHHSDKLTRQWPVARWWATSTHVSDQSGWSTSSETRTCQEWSLSPDHSHVSPVMSHVTLA